MKINNSSVKFFACCLGKIKKRCTPHRWIMFIPRNFEMKTPCVVDNILSVILLVIYLRLYESGALNPQSFGAPVDIIVYRHGIAGRYLHKPEAGQRVKASGPAFRPALCSPGTPDWYRPETHMTPASAFIQLKLTGWQKSYYFYSNQRNIT